jgi:hypothetical protein
MWALGPVAKLIAHEVKTKTGEAIKLDVFTGLGAFDVGGAARAMSTIIDGLTAAKAGGITPDELAMALKVSQVA